jgi:hypothetical protein
MHQSQKVILNRDRIAGILLGGYPLILAGLAAEDYFAYGWRSFLAQYLFIAALLAALAVGVLAHRPRSRGLAAVVSPALGGVLVLAAIGMGRSMLSWSAAAVGVSDPGPVRLWAPTLLTFAGGAAMLGASWALGSGGTCARWSLARRVAYVEIALLGGILWFGLRDVHAWPSTILLGLHLPATALLTHMGLCCGFATSLVISDFWFGRLGPVTPIGLPILGLANFVGMIGLLAALRAGRRAVARIAASLGGPAAA